MNHFSRTKLYSSLVVQVVWGAVSSTTGLETPNSTDNCALLLNRESQSLIEVVNALEAQSYSEHGQGDTHHWRHYAAKFWYPAFPDRADNNRYQCGGKHLL